MKRTTFYNLVILAIIIVTALIIGGCATAESTRNDAAKSFAQETTVATFDGHDYLVWVHQAYRMNGDLSYVSGITHSASCKNPEHRQSMPSVSPTPSPTPKKP